MPPALIVDGGCENVEQPVWRRRARNVLNELSRNDSLQFKTIAVVSC